MKKGRVKQEFWIKGRLIVIEGVPAGISPQCGEKVVRAEVGRSISVLIGKAKLLRGARTITVPVVRFPKKVA
jgi:YgiT-type zinc finger domain-containing protein